LIINQNADDDGIDSKEIRVSHRSRVIGYRAATFSTLLLTALAATFAATFWPIRGEEIQASFFVSLVGSSLTLVGLVFSLCLIGTQLIATRTNAAITRTFGILTWIYLLIFLVTTLWTLAISYYAGNAGTRPVICRTLAGHKHCISEAWAGRISIFGLSWSLLLLLPFVIYLYSRLAPRYHFTALVSSSLRARSRPSLERHCRRISDEVMSIKDDPRAVEEGLNQLLELGVIGLRRKRRRGSVSSDDIGMCVTKELLNLNYKTVHDIAICAQVLGALERWAVWMIIGVRSSSDKDHSGHNMSQQKATESARLIAKTITRNLRLWETSSDIAVRESLHLLQEMVEACATTKARMRVRFSEATIQLTDCVSAKLVDGSRTDFNLALRTLIWLCEFTTNPHAWNLGGKVIVAETARAFQNLGEVKDDRSPLSSWVLDEIHNLTDKLSLAASLESGQWLIFLRALADLKDGEVKAILRGPHLPKRHDLKVVSHAWEAAVIARLYATGRSAILGPSQASAIGLCTNGSDLPGLIALFEQLAVEYIEKDANYARLQSLLPTVSDNIRARFGRDPLITWSGQPRRT
jgi:hypothetical protein